jgi:hypothetical protein
VEQAAVMNASDLHGLWEFNGYSTADGTLRPPLGSPQGQVREFLFFGADRTFFYAKYARDALLRWDSDTSRFVGGEGGVLASGTWKFEGNRLVESIVVEGTASVLPNELTLHELTSDRLVVVEPTRTGQTMNVVYARENTDRFPAPPVPEEPGGNQDGSTSEDEAVRRIEDEQQHTSSLIDAGKFNSAHRSAQKTLHYASRVFGAEHLNTAACLVTLGACLSTVADSAGAVDALERAYRIYVGRVGPDHVLTASALNNLAAAYRAESRWRDAVDAAVRAVVIRSVTLGPDYRTATSVQNLGLALSGMGLVEDAAACYSAAAVLFDVTLGAPHPKTLQARQNIDLLGAALERDRRFSVKTIEPPRNADEAIAVVPGILAACDAKLADEVDPVLFALKFGRVAHRESYVNRIFDIRREQGRLAAQPVADAAHVGVLRTAQAHLLDAIRAPLVHLNATLKRVDPATHGPKARETLARAFPNFQGDIEGQKKRDEELRSFGIASDTETYAHQRRAHAEKYGYEVTTATQQFRRYAGHSNLPRGRYFTVCKDASGDDGQTLCRELFEYVDRRIPGLVFVSDTHDQELVRALETLGFRRNDPGVHFLMVMLVAPPDEPDRAAFRHFLGPALTALHGPFESAPDKWNGLSLVVIPTVAKKVAIDDVVDMRRRVVQSWLFRFFREGDGAVSLRSQGRTITDFTEMLPALLYPEYGGSGFTKSLGSWMRVVGVQGLVFPSARSDVSVTMGGDSSVTSCHGWNFVDYRNVDVVPDTLFHLEDNDWYGFVQVGGVTPKLIVKESSWAVDGIETRWRDARQLMLKLLVS